MGENWDRHYDQTTQAWYWVNQDTGETRWAEDDDNTGEGAAGKGKEVEEAVVDEWRAVHVVRYDGGGPVFKHWALYVVDKQKGSSGFLCHLEGERTKYRYVCKRANPLDSRTFIDMHQVGYVDTDHLTKLKDFAKAKKIKNKDKHWGCQDWTWEIIEELDGVGLLEHGDQFEEEREKLENLKGPG